ncbi:hypothetical protein DESC_180033 [Desulfosarcina cetonica]|nr:hypothetical protein DESC_180033 [Desulfosarcina cetonica]
MLPVTALFPDRFPSPAQRLVKGHQRQRPFLNIQKGRPATPATGWRCGLGLEGGRLERLSFLLRERIQAAYGALDKI